MDNNMMSSSGFTLMDAGIWVISGFMLIMAHVTRTDITFFMGLLVSILACIYYVVSIFKNINQKK
jgi:cobalamin-dependent methionine synthase I